MLSLFLTSATAEKLRFIITRINCDKIQINGKPISEGQTIESIAVITWADGTNKQAFDAIETRNLAEYRFRYLTNRSQPKSETIWSYLVRTNNLSTHNGPLEEDCIKKLKKSIDKEYCLWNSIYIPTECTMDSTHYFVAKYKLGNSTRTKRLEYERQNIIIDNSIFKVDNKEFEPCDIKVTISYVDGNPWHPVFVKSKVEIIYIPDKVN